MIKQREFLAVAGIGNPGRTCGVVSSQAGIIDPGYSGLFGKISVTVVPRPTSL